MLALKFTPGFRLDDVLALRVPVASTGNELRSPLKMCANSVGVRVRLFSGWP